MTDFLSYLSARTHGLQDNDFLVLPGGWITVKQNAETKVNIRCLVHDL